MLFLDLHRYGYVIGWIFGPWLFFFGLLVLVAFPAPHPRRAADRSVFWLLGGSSHAVASAGVTLDLVSKIRERPA